MELRAGQAIVEMAWLEDLIRGDEARKDSISARVANDKATRAIEKAEDNAEGIAQNLDLIKKMQEEVMDIKKELEALKGKRTAEKE